MNQKYILPQLLTGVALLMLLGGLGAYWPQLVGADDNVPSGRAIESTVADAITYQGYLTDNNDAPLNGDHTMQFRIYNASIGGTLVWNSGNINVPVNDGLFEARLAIETDIFNGEELWLLQSVNGENLTPRQELLPATMAHTLRPGAVIKATGSDIPNNYAVEVHMNNDNFSFNNGAIRGQATTGNAIYAVADNGRALYGQTRDGYAVYGFDGGSNANRGYGGYFYSTNGIGVYGYSNGDRTHDNIYAPGVYGESGRGVGVYGRGDTSNSSSFYNEGGRFEGGTGVYARGTDGDGYGGEFRSASYRGIFAQSDNNFYDGYFGVGSGISASNVIDRGGRAQSLAINLGDAEIAAGDLVAMAGVGTNPENGQPLLGVAKLDETNRNGVIGVAVAAISAETTPLDDGSSYVNFAPSDAAITADSYLIIITQGLAANVNVTDLTRDASWQIGDKIALSSDGVMQRAADSDAITIGRVAGPIDAESNTVPLFIDID